MASDERWWLGIDEARTFTDLVVVSRATGGNRDQKVLTTKGCQEEGVLAALEAIDGIVCGQTAGIKAVLSRHAAKTGLGHRDDARLIEALRHLGIG